MIGVEVRQQHQRQRVDAQPVEAAVHGAHVGSGVHQHSLARSGGQHERVALPDVAGDQHRARRRPAPDRLPQGPAEHEQTEQRGHRQGTRPGEPPQAPPTAEQDQRQEDRPAGAGRPRRGTVGHGGRPLGRGHQPAHRPAGDPDEAVGQPGERGSHQRRSQAQHGRRRDGGRGEQVRGQGDEADRPVDPGDQGGRDEARGGADGDGVGHDRPAAPPPERPRPAGREQHDGRRRGDGQGEARIRGQRGLGEQQHAHRPGEGGHRRPGPARRQRQQRHSTHGGRPEDARARAREQHETHQGDRRDRGLHPAVHRPPPQRPQHPREHDRDVGPRHRGEVRQPGPPELPGQDGVHGAGVADGETGQQACRAWIEYPPRRGRQTVPQVTGGLLHGTGVAHRSRWPARGEDRHAQVPGARWRDPDPRPHGLPREQVPPALGRGEQQDCGAQPSVRAPSVHELRHGGVDDDSRSRGPGQPVGVAVDLEQHRHRPAGVGDPAQGGRLPLQAPHPSTSGGDRQTGEKPQEQRRRWPCRSRDECSAGSSDDRRREQRPR